MLGPMEIRPTKKANPLTPNSQEREHCHIGNDRQRNCQNYTVSDSEFCRRTSELVEKDGTGIRPSIDNDCDLIMNLFNNPYLRVSGLNYQFLHSCSVHSVVNKGGINS